jgi:hypothetical protein
MEPAYEIGLQRILNEDDAARSQYTKDFIDYLLDEKQHPDRVPV